MGYYRAFLLKCGFQQTTHKQIIHIIIIRFFCDPCLQFLTTNVILRYKNQINLNISIVKCKIIKKTLSLIVNNMYDKRKPLTNTTIYNILHHTACTNYMQTQTNITCHRLTTGSSRAVADKVVVVKDKVHKIKHKVHDVAEALKKGPTVPPSKILLNINFFLFRSR